MSEFLILLVVSIFGILLGRYFALLRVSRQMGNFKRKQEKLIESSQKKVHPDLLQEERESELSQLNEYRHEAMEHNLEKVMELADQKEFLRNDDVERVLGVSNATAERYLDELEKRGKLEQIGERGRGVKYRERG